MNAHSMPFPSGSRAAEIRPCTAHVFTAMLRNSEKRGQPGLAR